MGGRPSPFVHRAALYYCSTNSISRLTTEISLTMALTSCRECGAAMTSLSHACPRCGAKAAPAAAAYAPPTPRPPEEPETPAWRTAAGWVIALAGCALFALLFFRVSQSIDKGAEMEKTAKEEIAREEEHLHAVITWAQDTSGTAAIPGGADRPAPTSDEAKRLWVISRMIVDEREWMREIRERHGVRTLEPPAAWGTARYEANARSYPEVETYLEGRLAATTEIERSGPAWANVHAAALAHESGMAFVLIRALMPEDFARVDEEEAPLVGAMLELHRHLVRVDPRVRPAEGDRMIYESEADLRRTLELERKVNEAVNRWNHAQAAKQARWTITLPPRTVQRRRL